MYFVRIVVVLLVCKLSSADIFSDSEVTAIDLFVNDVMSCNQIPGLTVAVVKGNETWTKGFGRADRERGINVTTDTLFGIGSVTKAFTTTLLAMLLNETNGRLTWTSKVRDILGSDFAFIDDYRTKELTLRDLLTHRTGLAPAMLPLLAGFEKNVTKEEFKKRFRFLPEVNSPRDVWEYNNWGYGLAGHIVEELSGESYEDTLEKRILQPLGMTKTRILGTNFTVENDGVARPYVLSRGQMYLSDPTLYDFYLIEGAGAIASSADDMAKWMHFLLQRGVGPNKVTLVGSKILNEVFMNHEGIPQRDDTLTKPTYPVDDLAYGYGYGWFSSLYREYKKVFHGGIARSFYTMLQLYFHIDAGVFVSLNGPGTSQSEIGSRLVSYFISDLLLGEKTWLDGSSACTFPSPWVVVPSTPQTDFGITNSEVDCVECFIGTFGHRLFGDVEVKVTSGTKSLELHYRKVMGSLNTTGEATAFILDLWDPYRVESRVGNETNLVPVAFGDLVNGKYNSIGFTLSYQIEFKRNVRFNDEIKQSKGKTETNGKETVHEITLCRLLIMSVGILCISFC